MLRAFLTTLLLCFPLEALARCDGTDLIEALPADTRSALEARAAAEPFAEGLLWQATRDDLRITLFGTYHFAHALTEAHLDALRPWIDAADAVFLEISSEDERLLERSLAEDPSVMFIMEGPTLPDLLGEEDWQALSAALGERGFPSFMAAKFKPLWASMMLGIGPCEAQSGALVEKGIDKRIGEYAAGIGTPSRSLEDPLTLLTLLDDAPQDEQLDAIRLFLDWQGDPNDVSYTLRERYLAEQTALIWEFSRLISEADSGPEAAESFAKFEALLLTERNIDWVRSLEAMGLSGEVFIAAGAAHWPGQSGVLNLLSERGFRLERLAFTP